MYLLPSFAGTVSVLDEFLHGAELHSPWLPLPFICLNIMLIIPPHRHSFIKLVFLSLVCFHGTDLRCVPIIHILPLLFQDIHIFQQTLISSYPQIVVHIYIYYPVAKKNTTFIFYSSVVTSYGIAVSLTLYIVSKFTECVLPFL